MSDTTRPSPAVLEELASEVAALETLPTAALITTLERVAIRPHMAGPLERRALLVVAAARLRVLALEGAPRVGGFNDMQADDLEGQLENTRAERDFFREARLKLAADLQRAEHDRDMALAHLASAKAALG